MSRRAPATLFSLLLCALVAHTQTLAHPGWRGNGITPEAWWKHAVFLHMPANSTFATAISALDVVSQIGADSIILPELQPAGEPPSATQPFVAKFGREDELEALLHEAAARRVHVLLTADISRLAAHSDEVRYWMSRGIAGFDVGTLTAADMGSLSVLRTSLGRFAGQKLLLAAFSGWFPERTLPPPRLPAGAMCLSRGSHDLIGFPEFVDLTLSAYHDMEARPSDVLGVPVIDAAALGSAKRIEVLQTYLAQRQADIYRARSGVPAKRIDPDAQPPKVVHRHHRKKAKSWHSAANSL